MSYKYDIRNDLSFFWSGCYSQWERSVFTFEGLTFNCCEQWMMFFKALVHEDYDVAKKVMLEASPKEQKKLGRSIKNFDEEKWNEVSKSIVIVGNYLKFTQNGKMKEHLMNDTSDLIVEASPYDKVWGIGLAADDEKALNPETWEGENRLGICVTLVRDVLVNRMDFEEYGMSEMCRQILVDAGIIDIDIDKKLILNRV